MRLVIFDFDWSLINENTDTYVIKELQGTQNIYEKAIEHSKIKGWTSVSVAVRAICP